MGPERATAVSAAVIMTMEPVFAAGLALVVAGDSLGAAAWVGGLVVLSGDGLGRARRPHVLRRGVARVECC